MSNESLALPELLAGLSDAADYDAVLAAIMATEHGRRFLTEFASRNRNADTAMVVGAIARVEAAIRGEAAPQAAAGAGAGELIEIAAAVDRIAAAIAAGAPRASDVAVAVERIQDIAFMLHEGPLEATLGDAFDAAVRVACRRRAPGFRFGRASTWLQALSGRVREMIDARMSHHPAAEPFVVPPDGRRSFGASRGGVRGIVAGACGNSGCGSRADERNAAAPSVDQANSRTDAVSAAARTGCSAHGGARTGERSGDADRSWCRRRQPGGEGCERSTSPAAPPQAEPEILDSASILE